MNIKALKPGSILSESSFFVVERLEKDAIIVKDDNNNEIKIGNKYVEQVLNSGDLFDSEEKKNMTQLAEIFLNSTRIAMTVCFVKKDTEKTKKAYTAEVNNAISRVKTASIGEVEKLVLDLIENPISKTIPGGERIMKGRHYGNIDDLGRVSFIDMEIASNPSKPESRIRQVDPRTIQWLIVNGVKYTLTK